MICITPASHVHAGYFFWFDQHLYISKSIAAVCVSSRIYFFDTFCHVTACFRLHMQKETWKHVALLSFQTLGVVYGHLSTAPLYVFGTIPREDFVSDETPYEFFSFIFWTITVISLLKYALIVLIADDDGEGKSLLPRVRGWFSQ